jgi:hypothetical protein
LRKKGLITNLICFIGLLLTVFCSSPSFADVTMRFAPNGYGSFLVVGENVSGVAALDITVDYDPLLLANPRVEVEGGTVTDIDAGTAGKLFVSIIRENPDAALYLILRFENPGKTRGRGVNSVTATSRDAPEKTSSSDAAVTTATTSSDTRTENVSGKDGATSAFGNGANVIDVGKQDHQNLSDRSPETALNTNVRKGSPSDREKSVLKRFIEFKGQKSLQSFAALFERSDRESAVQYPSIALSDGKTPVTIKLKLQQEESKYPDIAVSDASLVSFHKDGANSWVVTVLPGEGTWDARLVFGTGGEVIDFPLVIAPRVELACNVHEQNFLADLDAYLSGQAASHEKGNIIPLSEYIFTANYLADSCDLSSEKELR